MLAWINVNLVSSAHDLPADSGFAGFRLHHAINTPKTTIAKTSSPDEAAMIMVGMPFSAPMRRVLKRSIIGTTTAGETAGSTEPRMADSMVVRPSSCGPASVMAAPSAKAGMNESSSARVPT